MNEGIEKMIPTSGQEESPKLIESPSLLETIKRKRLYHENKIKDIDAAVSFLQENPKFEDFSKLVNQLRY